MDAIKSDELGNGRTLTLRTSRRLVPTCGKGGEVSSPPSGIQAGQLISTLLCGRIADETTWMSEFFISIAYRIIII